MAIVITHLVYTVCVLHIKLHLVNRQLEDYVQLELCVQHMTNCLTILEQN